MIGIIGINHVQAISRKGTRDSEKNMTVSKTTSLGTVYYKYDSENRLVSYGVTEAADAARLEYDADGNFITKY